MRASYSRGVGWRLNLVFIGHFEMDVTKLSAPVQSNALLLANAAEIGGRVIARIAGNEISSQLHGDSATKEKLSMLIMGQMTKHLEANNK